MMLMDARAFLAPIARGYVALKGGILLGEVRGR